MQAVGFKQKATLQCCISTTPPWLLSQPHVNISLHFSDKDDTLSEIFKHSFYEFCVDCTYSSRLYTDGLKMCNKVASAVVWQNSTKTVRLPNNASIFHYAISLTIELIRRSREKDFVMISDSMSSVDAVSGFLLEQDLMQKID